MNCLKKYFTFLLLVFFISGCTDDYASSAKNICECAKPLLELNQQIQSLASQGKQEEMQTLFPKAGELQSEMIKCSKKSLPGNIDNVALKKAIEDNCDLPNRLVDALIDAL